MLRFRKALALILLLALLGSCGLAGAEGHVHMMMYAQDPVWTSSNGRIACTFYYRCSICGEELVFTDAEPALTGEKPATCENGGYAFYRAAGWNGYNFTNSYEYFRTQPLGHEWQENWDCRIDGYVLTGGTVTAVCKRCGKTITADFGENEIKTETLKEAAPGAEGEQLCIVAFVSESKEFYSEYKLAIPALPIPVETVEEAVTEEAQPAEETGEPAGTEEVPQEAAAETEQAEEVPSEAPQGDEESAAAAAQPEAAETEAAAEPVETEAPEVIRPVEETPVNAEEAAESETSAEEAVPEEAAEEAPTEETAEEPAAEETLIPGAPVLLASPEDAVVQIGGQARFTARAQDYGGITWRLVNPVDGTEVLCSQAATVFPGLKIPDLHYNTITLINIPVELNGWQIYVTYSNDKGKTPSAPASIILTDGAGVLLPRPVPPAGE